MAADVGVGHTSYTRYDQRVTSAAVDWLKHADRTRPWVAFVSLVSPHYPLSAPREFADLYPLSEIPPPEIASTDEAHPAVAAMRDFFHYHDGFDEDLVRQARRAYFALCTSMDHNVGQVLAALDSSGQTGSTRIVYTSDHGEMLGNRGLWCKSYMYEDSVAVPMIVSGPGVPAARTVGTNVNLVDVAPTVTEVVGSRTGMGASLVSLANEPDDSERIGFSEYHDGGSITGSFAVRVGEWKYVQHVDYDPQLFNLVDDPDELVDLGRVESVSRERETCVDALRSIASPEAANGLAFESQELLLAHYGGRDAVANAFRFNHTPTPETPTRPGDGRVGN